MLFERTAISKKPEETINNDLAVLQSENKMSPDLFYRDPYILDGKEEPVALILCAEKSQQTVELLELDKGNIRVGQYLTKMPPKETLEQKLLQAIEHAKESQNIITNK